MKIRNWTLLACCVSALSGCATFGNMEEGLNALMGKPDKEAFSVLGYPNSKQEFGGDVVYVWGRSSSGTMYLPQTTTTTGYVGNTPVYGTTTYNQPVAYNHNCTIKLAVGPDGLLKHWEYDGNIGGCTSYIKKLKAYAKGE